MCSADTSGLYSQCLLKFTRFIHIFEIKFKSKIFLDSIIIFWHNTWNAIRLISTDIWYTQWLPAQVCAWNIVQTVLGWTSHNHIKDFNQEYLRHIYWSGTRLTIISFFSLYYLQIGIITMVPIASAFLGCLLFPILADILRAKRILSTTAVRKCATAIGKINNLIWCSRINSSCDIAARTSSLLLISDFCSLPRIIISESWQTSISIPPWT